MKDAVLLESRLVKGKRGLTITIQVLKHPCRKEGGPVEYYAFMVRWRDWESYRADVLGEWQQMWTTNISTVDSIKWAFRDQDYGVRPNQALAKMIEKHIPHERVSQ